MDRESERLDRLELNEQRQSEGNMGRRRQEIELVMNDILESKMEDEVATEVDVE